MVLHLQKTPVQNPTISEFFILFSLAVEQKWRYCYHYGVIVGSVVIDKTLNLAMTLKVIEAKGYTVTCPRAITMQGFWQNDAPL